MSILSAPSPGPPPPSRPDLRVVRPPTAIPRDLAGWLNPSARKVRRSAEAFLNRALILTRGRRAWEAGALDDEARARLARALVVYMRDEARIVAELFRDGQLSERQWRDRLAEISGAGAVAATFAIQGHRRLNREDRVELQSAVADQFGYLARFVRGVESGAIPRDGRIVARSLNYATAPWSAAQAAARMRAGRTGYTQERNLLGPAEHCRGCFREASRGWVPIGTLVPIGRRDCVVGCRCRYEFRGKEKARPRPAIVAPPPEPTPPPPPPPAPAPSVDPSWPPPAGSGAEPEVLAARRRWAEARRARLVAGLDAADRDLLAEGGRVDRAARDAIADELARLDAWSVEAGRNPRLIPPGPIRDRIRLYLEGEGGEKVRAIRAAGDVPARLLEARDRAEATFEAGFAAARAGDAAATARLPRLQDRFGRAVKAIDDHRLGARDRAAAKLAVPEGERLAIGHAEAADGHPGARLALRRPGDAVRRVADEAAAWLGRITRSAGAPPVRPVVGQLDEADKQRAYADFDASRIALSKLNGPTTAVHEFGHVLEGAVPSPLPGETVAARSVEFLRARTAGEPARRLVEVVPGSNYEEWEVGREDEFAGAFDGDRGRAFYAGKDYGHDHGSEILPMGLERLYTDPIGFAAGDPEFAAYVLGILDGSLR